MLAHRMRSCLAPRALLPLAFVAACAEPVEDMSGVPFPGTGGTEIAADASASGAGSGGVATGGSGGSAGAASGGTAAGGVNGSGGAGAGTNGTGGTLGAVGSLGSAGTGVTDGGGCVTGKKRCGNACVDPSPTVGCDLVGCTGCSLVVNGTMKCTGTQCDFDCKQGYVKRGSRCELPDAGSGGTSGAGGTSGSGGSAGFDAGPCTTSTSCNQCITCCSGLGKGVICSGTKCQCGS